MTDRNELTEDENRDLQAEVRDRSRLILEKMWYRRALYRVCGWDFEKVRAALNATEYTTLKDDIERARGHD